MGLTEGGGPGAAKELWEAGDLTGSARPRPAPWLKPSATANSCEGEGGLLEIFLPWIFLSPVTNPRQQAPGPCADKVLFPGRDDGIDLAAARVETIYAAQSSPGDARRCSEMAASAIYSSRGDMIAEAVPGPGGPFEKRGGRGGEGRLTLIASAAERTRGAIGACISRAACQNGLPGTRRRARSHRFLEFGQKSHSVSVSFNRNHHRNRNESEFWFRSKQKWMHICTRVLWSNGFTISVKIMRRGANRRCHTSAHSFSRMLALPRSATIDRPLLMWLIRHGFRLCMHL